MWCVPLFFIFVHDPVQGPQQRIVFEYQYYGDTRFNCSRLNQFSCNAVIAHIGNRRPRRPTPLFQLYYS